MLTTMTESEYSEKISRINQKIQDIKKQYNRVLLENNEITNYFQYINPDFKPNNVFPKKWGKHITNELSMIIHPTYIVLWIISTSISFVITFDPDYSGIRVEWQFDRKSIGPSSGYARNDKYPAYIGPSINVETLPTGYYASFHDAYDTIKELITIFKKESNNFNNLW